DRQVLDQLALHSDVPLVDSARTASVAIHSDAPPEVSKTAGLPRQWTDARIERRREQVGAVVSEAVAHHNSPLPPCRGEQTNRIERAPSGGQPAGDVPPIAQLAVAHAPAGAQHGLVIQSIGE